MKHQRHYEPVKFDNPYKAFTFDTESFDYGLKMTQDGKQETASMWCYHYKTIEEAQAKADELNAKFYLSDWDQTEIEEFFNSIDFTPLYKKVNELVELDLHFDTVLEAPRKNYQHSEYFTIKGRENLVDYFPILRPAWKEMYIQTFSHSIAVKERTGELCIWGTLDYAYIHQDGGSNGAEILTFWYSVSEGWKIITAIERAEMNKRRWEAE